MHTINKFFLYVIITLLLISSLACTPTITLGWSEVALVVFLGLILFGPVIFGLIRRLSRFKRESDK